MAKVILDLPPELERGLEQIVQSSGRTQDDVMRDALQSYIQQGYSVSGPAEAVVDAPSTTEVGHGTHEDHEQEEPYERPLLRSKDIIADPNINSTNINEWLEANWLNHLIDEQGQQPPPIMHQDDVEAQIRSRQRGHPFFRSLGAGDNAELQGEESEDWLKANWRPE